MSQIVHAAFVGFGEVNSPRELIEKKCADSAALLREQGVELVTVEPVSDDPEGKDIARAREQLATERFDALVVCIAGWIPSHAVIALIDEYRHLPMVLWGLAGSMHDGRLVTTADQAGTTALRKPMADLGYRFTYIYESVGEPSRAPAVASYLRAATAARSLRGAKVGMMGFRDMRLYGTLYDGVSLRRTIGTEVETFEMLEMVQRAREVSDDAVARAMAHIDDNWTFEKQPDRAILEQGCRYYCAIADKSRECGYQAVSLIDVDGMKKLLDFPPSMVMMLLADHLGVCTIPENDTLGAVTQLMVRGLTGQCAAYLEFYEFMSDRVLMGVPDYVPAGIIDGDVVVSPNSFGGFAQSMLNVSRLRTGEVTLCRLTSTGDRYQMHMTSGRAETPRAWEEAGWAPPAPQLPGLEIVLDTPVEQFARNVMGQHYIIAYGDHRGAMTDLCGMLGVEVI
ncbi:MAG: hypothetical protein GF331_18115 [Chitinivibrionales bacterium]|nr:hypothetical protein [Chitinivibrionales bacterium]